MQKIKLPQKKKCATNAKQLTISVSITAALPSRVATAAARRAHATIARDAPCHRKFTAQKPIAYVLLDPNNCKVKYDLISKHRITH